jgi:hypothetical protein
MYYELDGSFEVMGPYVYSICLAVVANESLPIGFSVAPTESEELFAWFSEAFVRFGGNPDDLFAKPLLSDEGGALKAFGLRFAKHFICFRHFLEKLGSRTVLAVLARSLLFTTTPLEFERMLHQTVADLNELLRQDVSKVKPTVEGLKAFCKFFGLVKNEEGEIIIGEPDKFSEQALWTRGPCGVTTCSNHIERLHLEGNKAVRGIRSIVKRCHKLLKVCTARFEAGRKFDHRKALERLAELRKEQKKANISPCADHSAVAEECNWELIYSVRYGADVFPCIHTVGVKEPVFRAVPEFTFDNSPRGFVAETYDKDWPFAGTRRKDNPPFYCDQSELEREPFDEDEVSFIAHLAREISQMKLLHKMDPKTVGIQLGLEWRDYCAAEQKNPFDIVARAAFRVRQLVSAATRP